MAVATWKNIAPVNSAGILNSINESGKTIGTGIAGIGDAFTQYSDNRSTQETNDLVAALAMAGNEADRDAIMQSMDPNSFADKSLVAEAYKDANAPVTEPTWLEKKAHEINLEYIKAGSKKKNKDGTKYTFGSISKTLEDRDGEEAITSGWMNLGGDTPDEEVSDRLGDYFSNQNNAYGLMNSDEKQRAIKIFISDARLDKAGINEYFLSDGETAFEDALTRQLDTILLQGGFLTDAQIEENKKNKKLNK